MSSFGKCPCLSCELNYNDDYCSTMDLAQICPFITKWVVNSLTYRDIGKKFGGRKNAKT